MRDHEGGHCLQNVDRTYVLLALSLYGWLIWWCAQQEGCVIDSGGLLVIQWGAAPSLRVQKQLFGRAGRQGDPGTAVAILLPDAELQHVIPGLRETLLHTAAAGCVSSP